MGEPDTLSDCSLIAHWGRWTAVRSYYFNDIDTLYPIVLSLTGVVAFQRSCPVGPVDSVLLGLVLWLCLLFRCHPIGNSSLLSLQLIGEEQGERLKYVTQISQYLHSVEELPKPTLDGRYGVDHLFDLSVA